MTKKKKKSSTVPVRVTGSNDVRDTDMIIRYDFHEFPPPQKKKNIFKNKPKLGIDRAMGTPL